ncbi:MAG: biopolymer transporter ExbD [Chthoniobacterales bacterium]|nr:biopolymer transporter ExbD [Chthoniobacterales bacterium]
MRFYTKKKRIPSITIVSLIDILAILLIFFIVTTTFRQKLSQLQINLPESTSAAPSATAPAKKNIILQIKSAESVTLDNKPIALDDLAEAIEEAQETYPDSKITMQADKDAPFGAVVKVLDALQAAGIKNIPTMTRTSTTH